MSPSAILFHRDAARLGPEVVVELSVLGAGHDIPQWRGDRQWPAAFVKAARDPELTSRPAKTTRVVIHVDVTQA